MTASDLVSSLSEVPPKRVVQEIEGMKKDGLVTYDDEHLGPETKIRVPTIRERTERDGG